ncbi:hypothetical protein PybrP1_012355 [[Pythium] brassicae (nom. inval.)]|nr:hypothetical protein PybrP1_012355 [[Pythium] brassicae (nom. inval.)]
MAPSSLLLLVLLLLVALALGGGGARAAEEDADTGAELFARDGFGRPVAWWAVLKLPAHVQAGSVGVRPTPCDCAPPDCANAPTASLDVRARATGLCYLYADARQPAFRHFRALGLDCLGQGGDDPLSHTLRQLRRGGGGGTAANDEPYWALFNDQFNGIARAFGRNRTNHSRAAVCSGGDAFSAHAKGAVGFRAASGGFFLQTSTPGFPDPTPPDPTEMDESRAGGAFVRLGCQADNNVQFAQHAFAASLAMAQLDALGAQLQTARLCSRNFYSGAGDDGLGALLASDAFVRDGAAAPAFGALYDALLAPDLAPREQSAALNVTLKRLSAAARSRVFVEPVGASLPALASRLQHAERDGAQEEAETVVRVLVKSPHTAVPPWALVAESLESDVSVASWWDGGFGIPNVCAGDDYSGVLHAFCLADAAHGVHLVSPNGTARFNIENLLEATWTLQRANETEEIKWHLVGGQTPDGNHAKWGLTTPRDGVQDPSRAFVTFADLNMEGFPCSAACNGSQGGRGGAFFSLQIASLHASLATNVVSRADKSDNSDVFVDARMCHFGCWRKLQARFSSDELPRLAPNATSFWSD